MSVLDRIPTVDNCCFFISLRIGSIIIGILTIIFALDTVFGVSATEVTRCSGAVFRVFRVIFFAFAALMILVSILLIYGVVRGEAKYAEWFIWLAMVNMLVQTAYGMALVVYLVSGRCWSSIGILVTIVAVVSIGIYWIMVVNSYRKEQIL